MARQSLKFEQWPVPDRDLWQRLVASGHILDDAGPGAHWRLATRRILIRDYGFWLSFLQGAGVELGTKAPDVRVTPGRVRQYILTLSDLAASTQAGAIRALAVLMMRAAPEGNWRWLQALRRPLDAAERAQRGLRKKQRIFASHKLYEAGVQLMEAAGRPTRRSAAACAVDFRDGLVIALLACRPLRIANLAGLRLDYHLTRFRDGYRIDIPAEETKTGQPIEMLFPEALLSALSCYLEMHRPLLLQGGFSDRLWIGRWGSPIKSEKLGLRISEVTERLLGVRVNPHLFRDAAATTIATVDPEHVRMVTPLLGHSTPVTAERYYNQARSIEAGRAHQANIQQLREEMRPLRRRTDPSARRRSCVR
jgi:integrase/recombinase XerD